MLKWESESADWTCKQCSECAHWKVKPQWKGERLRGECLIKIKTMPEMTSYPKASVAFDIIIHVFWRKHQTNLKMQEMVVEICGENYNNVQNKTPFWWIFTESHTQIWRRRKSVETVFFVGFIRPCFSVSIGRIPQWKSAQNSLEHIQGFGNGK